MASQVNGRYGPDAGGQKGVIVAEANRVTVGVPSAYATCAGPVSFVTKKDSSLMTAPKTGSVVFPTRSKQGPGTSDAMCSATVRSRCSPRTTVVPPNCCERCVQTCAKRAG